MARSKRKAAHNPAEQRRRDFEAVGLQPESADLAHQRQVEVTRNAEDRDGKTVSHNVARRTDAFDALKASMNDQPRFKGCYDAARRFEVDLLLSRCEGDRGPRMERVDCEPGREVEFRFIVAADNVAKLKTTLPRRDYWLLHELVSPSREYDNGWRGAVYYVTGEENPNAQGAAVRAACANLRDAYEAMDAQQPRRAA